MSIDNVYVKDIQHILTCSYVQCIKDILLQIPVMALYYFFIHESTWSDSSNPEQACLITTTSIVSASSYFYTVLSSVLRRVGSEGSEGSLTRGSIAIGPMNDNSIKKDECALLAILSAALVVPDITDFRRTLSDA